MVATMSTTSLPQALTSIAPPPHLSPTAATGASPTDTSPIVVREHHNNGSIYSSANGAIHHASTEHNTVAHTAQHHVALAMGGSSGASGMMTSAVPQMMYTAPPSMSVQSPQTQVVDPNNSSAVTYDYQAYHQGPGGHPPVQNPGASVAFAPGATVGLYESPYSAMPGSYPSVATSSAPVLSHAPPLPSMPQEIPSHAAGSPSNLPTLGDSNDARASDGTSPHADIHSDSNASGAQQVDATTSQMISVSATTSSPQPSASSASDDAKMISLPHEAAFILHQRHDSSASSPPLNLTLFSTKLVKASRTELLEIVQQFDTEVLRAACRQHLLVLNSSLTTSSTSSSNPPAADPSLASSSGGSTAAAPGGSAFAAFSPTHPVAAGDPYVDPAAALPPPPPPPMAEATPSSDTSLPAGVFYNRSGRFVCKRCNKDFASLSRVNAHLKVHSNHKPHACPSCDRRFARKHHMRDHVLTVHQNYKPFECPHCFRSFGKRSTLIRHISTHTESKIPCPVKACPRSFRDQKTMQNHLTTHQMPHPSAPSSAVPFHHHGGPAGTQTAPNGVPMDANGYGPPPGDPSNPPTHQAPPIGHPPAPPIGMPGIPGGAIAGGGSVGGGGAIPGMSQPPAAGASGSGTSIMAVPHDSNSQQSIDMKHYQASQVAYDQFSGQAPSQQHGPGLAQ